MLFNSYIFIFLFFPLVLVGYYALRYWNKDNVAVAFLIAMSMWFYGYNSIHYLVILIISIVLNFLIVELMYRTSDKGIVVKKMLFVAGLALNIGILFYFKYYDFFIENINTAFKSNFGFLSLTLPLGISFYTFQQLSYVIDSYKGECEKYSFLEYAAYVSFFPQLIAGPIVYHDEFIPQLRDKNNHRLNYENLSRGIYTFALGLAKKVLVADTFSKVVTVGYSNIDELNAVSVVVTMICYVLQLYYDFSGYCDMACGIGFMFNIELPINFNSPYKSESISELWNRWHITLNRFFIKYVFIPLGGSRKGKLRNYLNIFIVFFVSGVWHGANWTFILWGVINGLGNIFDKIFGRFFKWIPKAIRVLLTFSFFTFTCSIFRAESVTQAIEMWSRFKFLGDGKIYQPLTGVFTDMVEVKFVSKLGFGNVIDSHPELVLLTLMLGVLIASFTMRNTQEKAADGHYNLRRIAVTVTLVLWSVLSLSSVSEFLYFNF
jgi:D-alanyl-lipoteichoic acid acyltransferase DltB (MBOAT superfamily)